MEPQNIIVKIEGAIGVITLNRPKALNALNSELLGELAAALEAVGIQVSGLQVQHGSE